MSSLLEQMVESKRILVLDGGMGTQLEAQGCDLNDDLWSGRVLLEEPSQISTAHQAFIDAGVDILETSSYQLTVEGLMKKGLAEADAVGLFQKSTALALESASKHSGGKRRLVAASIGSYGATQPGGGEFKGEYGVDISFLEEFHGPRADIISSTGPDILAFETVPCVDEARAICRVLKAREAAGKPMIPAWISFSCKDGESVCSGEPYSSAVEAILEEGCGCVFAIGVNCTAPQYAESLLKCASSTLKMKNPSSTVRLVVYPNSGEVYQGDTKTWDTGDGAMVKESASLEELIKAWSAAGASIIGGCCRMLPEDIARIRKVVDHSSA